MSKTSGNEAQAIREHRVRLRSQMKLQWQKSNILKSIPKSTFDKDLLAELIQQPKQLHAKSMENPQILPRFTAEEYLSSKFEEEYSLGENIGEGGQGVVYQCQERKTGNRYAVKVTRSRCEETIAAILQSYKLLKILDHENIIKVKTLFIDEITATCYQVMELCQFLDLRKFLTYRKIVNLKQVSQILTQLLNAVQYLHSMGVAHRDIKPENILYNPITGALKLIDFEISRMAKNCEKLEMMTDIGSVFYRAPCSFAGVYGQQVDVWAVGVVAYELLVGNLPFKSALHAHTVQKIKNCQLNLRETGLSLACQHFLAGVLEKDPSLRLTPSEALSCQYLKEANSQPESQKSISNSTNQDDEQDETADFLASLQLCQLSVNSQQTL